MAAMAHLTYSELFADETKNPFTGDKKVGYKTVLSAYRPSNAPQASSTLLRNAVLDFSRPIGALGLFVQDGSTPGGTLHVLHGLLVHPGDAGAPTPERGEVFAFADEVCGVDILSVRMGRDQLEFCNPINIASTHVEHLAKLTAEPDDPLMGPFEDDADGVKNAQKARLTMFIPFEFVPLVIGKNLSPRAAFEILVPAIIAAGMEDACAHLLMWLQIAGTKATADNVTLMA